MNTGCRAPPKSLTTGFIGIEIKDKEAKWHNREEESQVHEEADRLIAGKNQTASEETRKQQEEQKRFRAQIQALGILGFGGFRAGYGICMRLDHCKPPLAAVTLLTQHSDNSQATDGRETKRLWMTTLLQHARMNSTASFPGV